MNNTDSKGWILFFQTPHDRIKYITSELDDPASMPYYRFIKYLFTTFAANDKNELINKIDSFKTILLNGDTGEWKEETEEVDFSKYGLKDLILYNDKRIKERESDKKKKKGRRLEDQAQNLFMRFWNEKKSKLFKRTNTNTVNIGLYADELRNIKFNNRSGEKNANRNK